MHKSSDHPLEQIREIRGLMERSSRFIGLSGLAGVSAGIFALMGAAAVYWFGDTYPFEESRLYYMRMPEDLPFGLHPIGFFLMVAVLVLIAALAGGIYFTTRRAKRKGQKIWDRLTQRLLLNLAIPLVAGGIFCLALLAHGQVGFVAPATLLFYGLALINGSKYTLEDVRYLGLCEIGLGLIASFNLGYGLEFWTIGFGFLHIFYGLRMYVKYERKELA